MLIDLTHTLSNDITVYPGTPNPDFSPANTIARDGFAELNIRMSTHSGTHIDAPSHILKGKRNIDEFPLEKFIGRAKLIDCRKKKSIEISDIMPFESQLDQLDFLLFYTGWQFKWKSEHYFEEFPVLSADAIDFLMHYTWKGFGFDAISVDPMNSFSLPNHHILLQNEILIIENLAHLDQLVSKEFIFHCIPLRIQKADGSPIRAFAQIL